MNIIHCDKCHKEITQEVDQHEDYIEFEIKYMATVANMVRSCRTIRMEVCRECAKNIMPKIEFKKIPVEVLTAREQAKADDTFVL